MQAVQQHAGTLLDRPKLMFFGAVVVSLFLTFYDQFEVTRARFFVVLPLVVFIASLFVVAEMPGITLLMFVMLVFALRKEYMKNNGLGN